MFNRCIQHQPGPEFCRVLELTSPLRSIQDSVQRFVNFHHGLLKVKHYIKLFFNSRNDGLQNKIYNMCFQQMPTCKVSTSCKFLNHVKITEFLTSKASTSCGSVYVALPVSYQAWETMLQDLFGRGFTCVHTKSDRDFQKCTTRN